jgi:hypothetical protein
LVRTEQEPGFSLLRKFISFMASASVILYKM